MKFIKETFLNLQPVEKIKRTPIVGQSGLYLEQNKTGFTFQLKYKSPVNENHRFMKLSRYKYGDRINKKMLDNILKQSVINQGLIACGIDPLEKKKIQREARKAKPTSKTVNQVFDAYTETNHFCQLSDSTQSGYLSVYKTHIYKVLGKKRLSEIKRPDIVTYLNDIERDSIHNIALITLQLIQTQAFDMGVIESPFLFGIKTRATGTRHKILTEEEVVIVMTSTSGWDSLRNICKMQLLTACRVSEVAGMRWEEIDMKTKTWTIPPERIKTEKAFKKMNRPHILPLMPKMSEILLQQRQHSTKGLVFPRLRNKKSKIPYYCTSAIGRWLKDVLVIPEGTHQLRRTAATSMANIKGISEFDIKIMLNHTVGGNTKKYINTQYLDRKLELFTKWHNHIDQLINSETGVQNHG